MNVCVVAVVTPYGAMKMGRENEMLFLIHASIKFPWLPGVEKRVFQIGFKNEK